MSFQSPLLSIPKKTTNDVDWTNPIRAVIAQSYGENPSAYVEECSVLQRCRQDAVKGAGSDQTARDLLYKYFGQLELLELRFAEIKVNFPWNDAFTLKTTTQTSLAFEKASIIHLLSAVLSSLAASGSRADPEGVKRSYFNSRAAAGMLTYINDNFLHAPSTDLSREVVHILIGVMTAQATEVFGEKLVDEKKAPALVSRSANSAAGMYAALVDEMKEFQGKGVFDRNWLYVLQIKAKLFASSAQYYRSVADGGSGKHGAALVRMKLADTLAQEAARLANNFTYTFVSSSTPTLAHDAATSLAEITKAHATLCSEAKAQAVRDNDLIYHDILPSEASLPQIEKLPAATPITIQDVYGNPDVSKLIGPDIFIRLIPLAVHESASVYSEEKAKLVRAEVERVDMSEGEIRAGLEHLGMPGIISVWQRFVEDEEGDEVEVGRAVLGLADGVERGSMDAMLRELGTEREKCERELSELSSVLDNESRECERMRAKYTPQFTQSPSGPHTAHFRSTISTNLGSLSAAAASDAHVASIWRDIQPEIDTLSQGDDAVRQAAQQVAMGKSTLGHAPGTNLLDLEDDVEIKAGLDEQEKAQLSTAVEDAREKMDRIRKIHRERDEVLRDLKEKIQNDDVSSLLLLNRRSQNVEPQLFANELEKFRPYQGRIAAAIQASASIVQELEMLVRQVEKGKGVKERQKGQKERQKRLREWERKLESAREGYHEVRAGAGKGLSYYESLGVVVADLVREVRGFVKNREGERNGIVSENEMRQRLSGSTSPPMSRGLDSQFAGLSMGQSNENRYISPPPPPQPPKPMSGYPVASTPTNYPPPPLHPSTPNYPPPPSQPHKSSSAYDFGTLSNLPSAFSTGPSPPPPPPPPPQPTQQRQTSYSSYPTASYAPPEPPRPQPSLQYGSYPAPQSTDTPSNPSPYPPPPPARQSSSSYYPAPQPSSHHSPPPPSQYQSYAPPPSQLYASSPPLASQQYRPPQYQQHQPPPQHPQHQEYRPPRPPQAGYGYQTQYQQGYQPPSQGGNQYR